MPSSLGPAGERVVEIALMTGREVVDTHNCLAEREQFFKKIGADEPGHSCDDPDPGRGHQRLAKATVQPKATVW
jgi:hypothetical protein